MRGRQSVRKRHDYPRVIYGPHGAHKTINGPDEWIQGWKDRPQTDRPPPPAGAPAEIPYTRAELKAMLREAGIPFKERAADSELYKVLTNG